MSELKPCPFCGGSAKLDGVPALMSADCCDVLVECSDCGAKGAPILYDQGVWQDNPEPEAITAWNTRATDTRIAELEAEVERLRSQP